jgi:hypothetical protein
MKKTETVAEFLARGGVINKIPANQSAIKGDNVKSTTNGGPANLLSMDEADLYYGEIKARKAKKKNASVIDLSALPEALRKKYVDDVIHGDEEDSEED